MLHVEMQNFSENICILEFKFTLHQKEIEELGNKT